VQPALNVILFSIMYFYLKKSYYSLTTALNKKLSYTADIAHVVSWSIVSDRQAASEDGSLSSLIIPAQSAPKTWRLHSVKCKLGRNGGYSGSSRVIDFRSSRTQGWTFSRSNRGSTSHRFRFMKTYGRNSYFWEEDVPVWRHCNPWTHDREFWPQETLVICGIRWKWSFHILNRFDVVHECDRRTDWQTDAR